MSVPGDHTPTGFRLGSLGGTTIHLEGTFLILMGLFVILDIERGRPLQNALLWIPILLISVLFHEIGHAALIGLFGFGRSAIVLGGFGGVTINRRTAVPWKEIVISLAGPAFSVLLSLILIAASRMVPLIRTDPMLQVLVPLMIFVNFVWAVFNLVPVYPLDGGQALQNLMRAFLTERRSAFLSIWISLILGVTLAVLTLLAGEFFIAIVAAMLSMQNFQRWQLYRRMVGGKD